MALGWSQLAGFIGKALDRATDPRKVVDRKLKKAKKEFDKLESKKNPTVDDQLRRSVLVDRILQLRRDRANLR